MSQDDLRRRRLHLELDEHIEHVESRRAEGTINLTITLRDKGLSGWRFTVKETARPWRPRTPRKGGLTGDA